MAFRWDIPCTLACSSCASEGLGQRCLSTFPLSLQVHVPGLPLHPLLAALHILLGRRDRGEHRTAAGHGTCTLTPLLTCSSWLDGTASRNTFAFVLTNVSLRLDGNSS